MAETIFGVIREELLSYDLSDLKMRKRKKNLRKLYEPHIVFYVKRLKKFCTMSINDVIKADCNHKTIETLSCHRIAKYKHVPIKKIYGLDYFKLDNPYSAMEEFEKQDDIYYGTNSEYYLMKYALYYEYNKYFEQLVKGGFSDLIFSILCEDSPSDLNVALNRLFDVTGKNVSEILELKNYQWKLLKNIKEYELFYEIKNMIIHNNLDYETIKKIMEIADLSRITKIKAILNQKQNGKQLYDIKSLLSYMHQATTEQGLEIDSFLDMLRDYNRMSKNMGEVPIYSSKNLERDHDVTTKRYMQYEDECRTNKYNTLIKERYEELKYLEYEDENKMVLVPSNLDEIYQEGKSNHNCVASYAQSFAEGRSNIFFIRKKEDINNSYITVELDRNCERVLQAYYKYNKKINEIDRNFINKWLIETGVRRRNFYATS